MKFAIRQIFIFINLILDVWVQVGHVYLYTTLYLPTIHKSLTEFKISEIQIKIHCTPLCR